jgi:hypothetical protein
MPNSVDSFRYDVPFIAPAIPYPPVPYSADVFEEIHSAFRLYFNQIDNTLRATSKTRLSTSQTGDYITTGRVAYEIIIMANPVPAVVILRANPDDNIEVSVKRATGSARVTIMTEDNESTIDGDRTLILDSQYDAPHLVYTTLTAEWLLL